MKKFNKKEIFTIPNIMGYCRILLIPVFCYLYIFENNYTLATIIVLISSLSDLFDGYIARRFNQVTELGKALDPVADKLTHGALALCLAARYPLMWALIGLMIIKEGYMGIMGIYFFKEWQDVRRSSLVWQNLYCYFVYSVVCTIPFPKFTIVAC